jgi:hypothetical protein
VLLNRSLKRNWVRADNLANLVAVLEQQESGHGAHGLLLSNFGDLVDVDFVEARVSVVVGEPVGGSTLVVRFLRWGVIRFLGVDL